MQPVYNSAACCNTLYDLLRGTRQAHGPGTGAARAALSAHQRPDHHRDRHGILLRLRRGAAQLCGHQLLSVLRPGAVARAVESGEEEAGLSSALSSAASSRISRARGSTSSATGVTVTR